MKNVWLFIATLYAVLALLLITDRLQCGRTMCYAKAPHSNNVYFTWDCSPDTFRK